MRSDVESSTLRPPARHRGLLGIHPGLLVAFAALVLLPLYSNAYWTFNVMAGFVLAISCLGLLVLAGWAREISLAQAGLTGSALYLCQYASRGPEGHGWAFPLAAAWAIGFVVAVSFVTGLVAMRLAGPYALVLTLAVQFWLENSLMIDSRLVVLTTWPTPRPSVFGFRTAADEAFYYLLLAWLAVIMVALFRARHSRFGRSMIMVGADPEAAAAAGVSPWRYRAWAFVVAGALAGLAGALAGPLYIMPPGSGSYISWNSVVYLAVPVLAGFDSIAGTVAVAVGLTLAPQVVPDWDISLYLLGGVAMAVGCLLGPRGLARLVPRGF